MIKKVISHFYGSNIFSNCSLFFFLLHQQYFQPCYVKQALQENNIEGRRYFYPSLSAVDIYGKKGQTPVANDISSRILCLPLFSGLSINDINKITLTVKNALQVEACFDKGKLKFSHMHIFLKQASIDVWYLQSVTCRSKLASTKGN